MIPYSRKYDKKLLVLAGERLDKVGDFMSFAKKLDRLMNETGMTNYRLAKILNVHQTTIANWRLGKTEPKVQTVIRIAKAFSVSVEELLK